MYIYIYACKPEVFRIFFVEKKRNLSVPVSSPMLLFNALGHTGLCKVGSSWQYALMPSIFSLGSRAILGPRARFGCAPTNGLSF